MIAVFHLAFYLTGRVWENYISPLFRPDVNNDSSDYSETTNNIVTNASAPKTLVTSNLYGTSNNEPNLNSRTRNETNSSMSATIQLDEGDQFNINAGSEEESEVRRLIYNVKPKFECSFESEEKGMKFIPPVYTQRYMLIEEILRDPCWVNIVKKVVDFGCAELTFELRHLKKCFGIEEIVAVDIDSDLLSYNCIKMIPSATDYINPRPTPLTVRVFCGSVAHTHDVLLNTDAIIAIELIEHLYPNDLECLPFTVFGFVKPKIAIFTTPNADFNVLFPDFSGFRHYDHKFEWSRQQFEDWGNNLVLRYPDYTVTYKGVGPGPSGSENLGCCSQMATFVKVYESNAIPEDEIHIQDGPYELIREYIYPFHVDKRTHLEKIRDEAIFFVNRCIMLSRCYDDDMRKEIPLKHVMDRIKFYNRIKLKSILLENKFEVTTNAEGYEVVLIPDSDEEENALREEEELREENAQEISDCSNDFGEVTWVDKLVGEEDWDIPEAKPSAVCKLFDDTATGDDLCSSDKSVVSSNSTTNNTGSNEQLLNTVCHSAIVYNLREKCPAKEAVVPDVSVVYDRFTSSNKDLVLEQTKDSIDYSFYETPFNNGIRDINLTCESSELSATLCSDQTHIGCNKVLSFETPEVCRKNGSSVHSASEFDKTDPFCYVNNVTSSLDASIYSTPCCSQLHKTYIPKCLSLQQLSGNSGYPLNHDLEHPSKLHYVMDRDKEQISKSMEGFKSQESCDIHETCSNGSRVLDSGYPDSYSEHNMDLDLTPEQFDDIETESEGNDVSSRSLSPPLVAAPQIPHMVDDVQNGDVANNNRDGEGNNMVADMDEEPLEFEAQIEEVNNEIPNFAGVGLKEHEFQQIDHGSLESERENDEIQSIKSSSSCKLLAQNSYDSEISDISRLGKKETRRNPVNIAVTSEQQSVKSTQSDSSIATSWSWSHLESSESQTCVDNSTQVGKDSNKLKKHNSLTTVLEGCSKFSNCSLVRPITKDCVNEFPKWMVNIDFSVFENIKHSREQINTNENNTSFICQLPQYDNLSQSSIYQSAGSLVSLAQNDVEQSAFPEWLLAIQMFDTEHELESRNSLETVWNDTSLEDLELNYDVQVDARGGGDPLRDTWH